MIDEKYTTYNYVICIDLLKVACYDEITLLIKQKKQQ